MSTIRKILIINGPNMDRLGKRQPEIYGTRSLDDIADLCQKEAVKHQMDITFKQSNHEGEIISWIGRAEEDYQAIIINPAAYSHCSIAILDAILSIKIPVIEVHLTNILNREELRQTSITAAACQGVICGFGAESYLLAITVLSHL